MQNPNEKKEQNANLAKNLDASKMSAAEILEAVGISSSLTDAILQESEEKQKKAQDSDLQERIARIQKQKAEKLQESLNSSPEQTTQTKKIHIKSVAVSDTSLLSKKEITENPAMPSAAVAVAEPETETEPPEPPKPVRQPPFKSEPGTEPPEFEPELEPEPEPEKISKPKKTKSKTKKSKKKSKKAVRLRSAKVGALVGASIAGVIIAAYFVGALSYQGKFLPRTYINSLSVAGMTTEEAHDALLEEKKLQDLKLVTAKGEEIVFPAQDFGAKYTIPSGALNEAASEGNFNWVSKLFKSSQYAVKYEYSYSEEDLKKLIQNHNWGSETSQNAKIVRTDAGNFEIQPETAGDQFDTAILTDYVIEQLNKGITNINMQDSGCYEPYKAKVTAENLQHDLEAYNRYAKCDITFDFEDRTIAIDKDTLSSWLYQKDDGSFVTTSGHGIPINYEKVAEFVENMADQTDTYGKDHEFYATLDGAITVPWTNASCYGWQIDRKATVSQISDLLEKGESATVQPVYTAWGTGYTRQKDDIGTTYIEVDISAQHFWYYKNNEVIMDYDVVSGTETDPEKRTPRGICKIVGHVRGKTLGTYAVQGYECWVDFWMPFNYMGCGFHDLSRGAYGGSIYMYNGSHGCLNMRWSEAENLFDHIEDGLPVIIHD